MTELVRFRYRAHGVGAGHVARAIDLKARAKAATVQAECGAEARSINAVARAGG
jgi:hypothetical protein